MKGSIIAFILCLSLVTITSCDRTDGDEARKQRQAQLEEARVKSAIAKLVEVHGAVADWRKALATKEPSGRIYSAELAPVLVRRDGRPLMFIADAVDVSALDGGYICKFQAYANMSQKIDLTLECSTDQANQIMREAEGKYAVVAKIVSVGTRLPKTGGDDFEATTGAFPVLGICLGVANVGKNYIGDTLEMVSYLDTNTDKTQ